MLLELDLAPGVGLGPMYLGMPLAEAVRYIQDKRKEYRCVEVKYADQAMLDHDLILNLPEHGMHLRFESHSQCLRLIEIYDISRIQLRYGKGLLGGASHAATALLVYNLLGPTTPGILDTQTRLYPVHYPGLLFLFPIPAQYAQHCLENQGEMPLEFPDKTTPVASRVCIYAGSAESPQEVAKISPPPLPKNALYYQPVSAIIHRGLEFGPGGQRIYFGDSPQDVCSEIGPPNFTAMRPLEIIRGKTQIIPSDYFYRYVERGFDVLFDGTTNKAKKFILRTNAPGHPEFNNYSKCNFTLRLPSDKEEQDFNAISHGKQSNVASDESSSSDTDNESNSGAFTERDMMSHHEKENGDVRQEIEYERKEKLSPSWNRSSPRDVITGAIQDFLSGPSDSSRAESSRGSNVTPASSNNTNQNEQEKKRGKSGSPWNWGDATGFTQGIFDFGTEALQYADNVLEPKNGWDKESRANWDQPSEPVSYEDSDAQTQARKSKDQHLTSPEYGEESAHEENSDQRDGWENSSLGDALLNIDSEIQSLQIEDLRQDFNSRSNLGEEADFSLKEGESLNLGRSETSRSSQKGITRNMNGDSAQIPAPDTPSTICEKDNIKSSNPILKEEEEQSSRLVINSDSKFDDVQRMLGHSKLAAVHNQGMGSANPFAKTLIYGYEGAAFEVMRNGHLASITLYT